MTPTQIAWAAGLFEGEGCMHKAKHRPNSYTMELWMTDFDVVRRFADIIGVGTVSERTRQQAHWKPILGWRLYKRADISKVLDVLLPYFGDRRAHKALDILDNLELA
jgi:hypothetical protein